MTFDCLVLLYPKPGAEDKVKAALESLVTQVVEQEPKCQIFAPYRATHFEDQSVCFVLRERFDDLKAFEEHQATDFVRVAMEASGEFVMQRLPFVLEGMGVGKGV
jgi:quinol monooxygenase YgiN